MEAREVRTGDGTQWQCVEAFAGVSDNLAEKVKALENDNKVEVICTPSGGAQTIRLKLLKEWNEKLSDEQLIKEIEQSWKSKTIL